MSGIKKVIMALLILTLLATVVLGMLWHVNHYVTVDLTFYPKDTQVLDLRDQDISVQHYKKLSKKLPDCKILWNVPFQGKVYSQETETLTIQTLTEEDVAALAYLPKLKSVDATACTSYALLAKAAKQYPEVELIYTISIGGEAYDRNTEAILVDGITEEELGLLQYLPNLARVSLKSNREPEMASRLAEICHDKNIAFSVTLGGESYDESATELRVTGITQEELGLLEYLPKLETLHISNPAASAEQLQQLKASYPNIEISWDVTVQGMSIPWDVTELDLSSVLSGKADSAAGNTYIQGTQKEEVAYSVKISDDNPFPDKTADTAALIAELEYASAYLPNLESVSLCGVFLDNEPVARFREAHREDFKVVWTVKCGKLATRTDTTYFMPTKYYVYYFFDEDCANLIYCEDMVCVDLGHMSVSKIDWVEYMPNLTYLILAHTQVQYIEPISACKNLKFLELDNSPIRDFTPLVGCTGLEDLNIGSTYADVEPLCKMTWLKNLWMIFRGGSAYQVTEALPDTKVVSSGNATVAGGWRNLQNYYDMRDVLGMGYMSW